MNLLHERYYFYNSILIIPRKRTEDRQLRRRGDGYRKIVMRRKKLHSVSTTFKIMPRCLKLLERNARLRFTRHTRLASRIQGRPACKNWEGRQACSTLYISFTNVSNGVVGLARGSNSQYCKVRNPLNCTAYCENGTTLSTIILSTFFFNTVQSLAAA